jgi:hypothetical protein
MWTINYEEYIRKRLWPILNIFLPLPNKNNGDGKVV